PMPLSPTRQTRSHLSRRQFLGILGAAALSRPLAALGLDWEAENPLAEQVREHLEAIFADKVMALDFRRINAQLDEDFRIQINAFDIYPVASCFKAFVVLYYYVHTPRAMWDDAEGSALYSTAVFSNNILTGAVLADVASRVRGPANALQKFNNFLWYTLGIKGGLYTWDWPGTPTAGFYDTRYGEQSMVVRGQSYPVINAFTAADLGRGYDILTRGDTFSVSPTMRDAIRASRAILSITAPDYQSPIERVFPAGYMGKDGVLPAGDIEVGRVVDDAGVVTVNGNYYLISFMSAGESESVAINVLTEIINQINIYEAGG
ncbi:MAG: hypothetical protein K8L99_31190, partial [Anaerolineae bacterium]|nr:hypothetical protein [Anaerolineae bacterium]